MGSGLIQNNLDIYFFVSKLHLQNIKITLHHFAYNIQPNTFEKVLELFVLFGCTVAYRKDGARWCQIEQKPIPVDIQIIEVNDNPVDIAKKLIHILHFFQRNHMVIF
ncbi:MAG: hypothetical protein CR972_04630 [Candidatus Moraniibacteriota bacterium]|nr:MAG: hypothetical protein CR972_04630 [Candidatus Moranbacteria bacterium]